MVGQIALRAVLRFLEEYAKATYENAFKSRLFAGLLTHNYGAVTATHSGEWMNRLTSDTVVVSEGLTTIVPGVAGMVTKMAGALVVILIMEPRFAYILVPGGILLVLLTYIFRKQLKKLHKQMQEKDGHVRIFLQEHLGSLMIVKAFGNHDVYQKPPVYNFEMHRSLYGKGHDERWVEYYSDIKDRLLSDQPESSCGYHMSDEDFYIYITSHAYKHYSGNGTGIRTLLDFYAYLNAKEESLDLDYIKAECRKLGISDFEKRNRRLCRKVFSSQQIYDRVTFEQSLSADEMEMLKHYLSSGVYGTLERMVENRMEKLKKTDGRGKLSKLTYYWHRVFPVMELYEKYPLLVKHKWLIPAYWFYRIVRMLFSKKRRNNMLREVKTVKKVTAQESFNEQSTSGY